MDRIKELISKMTLEEKASLCSGADNWQICDIMVRAEDAAKISSI